jgi:hypothetical protein
MTDAVANSSALIGVNLRILQLQFFPEARSMDSPGEIAELYLGNILYALELAAISLEEQGKGEDAAFYRGIARKLAQARGAAAGGGGTVGGD